MTHLKYIKYKIFTALLVVILTACSSGSGSSENNTPTPNPDPVDTSNLTEDEKVLQQELNLPSKPDEDEAKAEFVDTNNNEIRDDVEWYIAKTHYSADAPEASIKKVKAFNQIAVHDTHIINSDDPQEIYENYLLQTRTVNCLYDQFTDENDYLSAIDEIIDLLHNTNERFGVSADKQMMSSRHTYSSLYGEEREAFCSNLSN